MDASPSPSISSSDDLLLSFLLPLQSVALAASSSSSLIHGDGDGGGGGGGCSSAAAATVVVFDPKVYVDLPLKFSLAATAAAFSALPRSPITACILPDTLEIFLKEYFEEPGSDLVAHTPFDYIPNPPNFLPRVQNSDARTWGLKVHSLWPSLARQVSPSVEKEPDRHTLLPLKHPFVVPGERFCEVYYWDSYWIIRGLLASQMLETATGMVENMLALIETCGFVPNGTRTYYKNRSQPPVLSMMVRVIFAAAGDLSLAKRALPLLLQEHRFWTSEPHEVVLQDSQGCQHRLSRYYAQWDQPRPECSTIDTSIAKCFSKSKQLQLYHDLATAAESGWDFSSRWMEDQEHLSSLRTSSIVPVDLNAFLLQMELNIAFLATALNNTSVATQFTMAADARRSAIEAILWNDGMGQWLDYWLPLQSPSGDQKRVYTWDSSGSNRNIYASNFVPIWCGIFLPGDSRIDQVVAALSSSRLLQPGGIATSLKESGQQWDFPNAWAPLQHMIIEGLASSSSLKAQKMAEVISRSWLRSNYAAFQEIGRMIEKYDARYCGKVGGGGEYETQTGFGWTNGVVLTLLHDYGFPQDVPLD